MGNGQTIPVAGIALALVTGVALLVLGVDIAAALCVMLVWIGSLLLVSGRPPEAPVHVIEQPFGLDAMRHLIENASTPLLVTQGDTIALANRSARRIMGQHMIGQDARVAFRQPEAIALLGEARNGKAIVRGLVRRQDIWQINRQAVGGDLAVIELINQTAESDISRAHTDFVANASHELRTPLSSILGYVETLNESGESLDTPTARKFLDTIEREARRLQSLISDLMSLSRVEAEKHDLPREVHDLRPLVEQAARDAAGPQRIERVEFDLKVNPPVCGDRQQLEQLVRNLVDNALKYGASDRPIIVRVDRARDRHARLSVIDHGDGIAPEQIPLLTRRFYRTDPGRSRASGGTGLGLAIVKHIVERHRGRLDIESKRGTGTQVSVRIPIASQDRADGDVETDAEPARTLHGATPSARPSLPHPAASKPRAAAQAEKATLGARVS